MGALHTYKTVQLEAVGFCCRSSSGFHCVLSQFTLIGIVLIALDRRIIFIIRNRTTLLCV